MTKRKNKDGKTIFLSPGIYEIADPVPNRYLPLGYWQSGTRFIIEKHLEKTDGQPYEYHSLRVAGSKMYLINSYQHHKWNVLATRLRHVTDLEDLVKQSEIPAMFILDQLEQTGQITRDKIWQAIKECKQIVE